MKNKTRCSWPGDDPLYVSYHDEQWGVPVYQDQELFAKLILDGAQAGLSWITILRKMPNYYSAFDGLNPHKMALYDEKRIEQLLQNPGIIRNRLKVKSAVSNAQCYLDVLEKHGSFSEFLWKHVDGAPIINEFENMSDVPSSTSHSDAMSKDLKAHGFKFVGTTIVYAFMQAVGMVNDHVVSCFRHTELS